MCAIQGPVYEVSLNWKTHKKNTKFSISRHISDSQKSRLMNQFFLMEQLERLVSYPQFVTRESFSQLLTHLMWVWFLYLWDTIIAFIKT